MMHIDLHIILKCDLFVQLSFYDSSQTQLLKMEVNKSDVKYGKTFKNKRKDRDFRCFMLHDNPMELKQTKDNFSKFNVLRFHMEQ